MLYEVHVKNKRRKVASAKRHADVLYKVDIIKWIND